VRYRVLPWTRPYEKRIVDGLQKTFDTTAGEPPAELSDIRLIVFSDQHRGTRDGADDFRRCERAYNGALAWYFEQGYELVALGDVEELWENDADDALEAYPCTLELERLFHDAGRYTRVWGNHDHQWSRPREVQSHLQHHFSGLQVREALRLPIVENGTSRGLLFFAHGHQGTRESDHLRKLSQPAVRHLWKPLQKRLNRPWNTPALDWNLRERHDRAMFAWAKRSNAKPVLIAGHTHRPVFGESVADEKAERSPQELAAALADARAEPGQAGEKAANLWAELEWTKAEERRLQGLRLTVSPPCYFNTGCCSFGDGDVTGIEIADSEIRLVRWAGGGRAHERDPLACRPLDQVLREVEEQAEEELGTPPPPRDVDDCTPSAAPAGLS
jgi:predicted phosphodiesterase